MLDPQGHLGRIARLTRLMRQQGVDGAIFTAESNIAFNCEEIVAVTANGAELLTTTPRHITYIQ